MVSKWLLSLSKISVLTLLHGSLLLAQYTTASLGGAVTDGTGAAVPATSVTVRNPETGFTQNTTSGADGAFLFPRLPVGSYQLKVEKEGFAAYERTGITLTVDQSATVDVALQLGKVTDTIRVTGETELVTTRTAA
ncbi:MAG TPA: carboxypeptidase-like regulatory domain-containing protein, partial [Bryobacteraceae bacterium]|nr:carboxypeptidase-like regulatory domain-containing protein [Bryobacteraceae bacterium]